MFEIGISDTNNTQHVERHPEDLTAAALYNGQIT